MWTYHALAYLSYHEEFRISYCQFFIHDDRQSLNYLLEESCFWLIHLIIVDNFSLKILSFFYPVSCCHQYPYICLNLLVMSVWILIFVTLICHSPFICLMLWYKVFFCFDALSVLCRGWGYCCETCSQRGFTSCCKSNWGDFGKISIVITAICLGLFGYT